MVNRYYDVSIKFGQKPNLNLGGLEKELEINAVDEGEVIEVGFGGYRALVYKISFEGLEKLKALKAIERFLGLDEYSHIEIGCVDEEKVRRRKEKHLEAKKFVSQVERPPKINPRRWERMLEKQTDYISDEEWLQFVKDMSWFDRNEEELRNRYGNQSLAIYGEEVVYNHQDRIEVLEWLGKNYPSISVYVGTIKDTDSKE